MAKQGQRYKKITREEKLKAIKFYLNGQKSMSQIEKEMFGYENCTGCIARWIIEYNQEGEEKAFKKKRGLKKITNDKEVRYEILKKFNAFLSKEIKSNSNLSMKTKKNIQ